MFCSNCGARIVGHGKFCAQCGAASVAEPETEQPNQLGNIILPPEQPKTINWDAGKSQQRISLRQSFRKSWRDVFGSVVFLVFVICFSAVQLLTIIRIEDILTPVYDILEGLSLLSFEGAGDAISMLETIQLFIILPGVLMAIGYWMIYADSKATPTEPIKTGGLSLVKGVLTAFQCLAIFFEVVLLVMLASAMSELVVNKASQSAIDSLQSLMWTMLVVFTLVEAVLGLCISAVGKMRNTAENDNPTGCGRAGAVGIICFVIGIFITIAQLNAGMEMTGMLNGVGMILLGVVLHMYRSAMEKVEKSRVGVYAEMYFSSDGKETIRCPQCNTKQSADNKTCSNCFLDLTKQ